MKEYTTLASRLGATLDWNIKEIALGVEIHCELFTSADIAWIIQTTVECGHRFHLCADKNKVVIVINTEKYEKTKFEKAIQESSSKAN